MDEEPAPPAVDLVLLFLGDVVSDVVHHAHAEIARRPREHALEDFPRPVSEKLPVGEGEVGGASHGAEIALRFLGVDRRAGKLAIGDGDPIPTQGSLGRLQVVRAHLMSKATRARMDHHGDLA